MSEDANKDKNSDENKNHNNQGNQQEITIINEFGGTVVNGPWPNALESNPLAKGGGGGDSGGMDQIAILTIRVDGLDKKMDRLEERLDKVEDRLSRVETQLGVLNGKMDILLGQIVGRLPTWWQMPAVIIATIAVLTAVSEFLQHFHLALPPTSPHP